MREDISSVLQLISEADLCFLPHAAWLKPESLCECKQESEWARARGNPPDKPEHLLFHLRLTSGNKSPAWLRRSGLTNGWTLPGSYFPHVCVGVCGVYWSVCGVCERKGESRAEQARRLKPPQWYVSSLETPLIHPSFLLNLKIILEWRSRAGSGPKRPRRKMAQVNESSLGMFRRWHIDRAIL